MRNAQKTKPCLKLQSYKVDSRVLAEKIGQLNSLKQELQSTLSRKRTEGNSIIDELSIIKAENKKLTQEIHTLKVASKAQDQLIAQLQTRLKSATQQSTLYLDQITQQSTSKQQLEKEYQQKIQLLLNTQEQFKESFRKDMEQMSKRAQKESLSNHQHSLKPIQVDVVSSILQEEKRSSSKIIKRLTKPSVIEPEFRHRQSISVEQKYRSNNMILQGEEDSFLSGEDIYLEAIRQLYKQLNKIGIKAKEIHKIPPLHAFHQLQHPQPSHFTTLLTHYPFQLKQHHKAELVFHFFSHQCKRTRQDLNGKHVIQQIIRAIQEIEESNSLFSSCRVDFAGSVFLGQKENVDSIGEMNEQESCIIRKRGSERMSMELARSESSLSYF